MQSPDESVEPGPALRDANGVEHFKVAGGGFPLAVAEKGARMKVQHAQSSRETDRVNILRVIAHIEDCCELPAEHPQYETVNDAVWIPLYILLHIMAQRREFCYVLSTNMYCY